MQSEKNLSVTNVRMIVEYVRMCGCDLSFLTSKSEWGGMSPKFFRLVIKMYLGLDLLRCYVYFSIV